MRYDAIEEGLAEVAAHAERVGASVHMPRIACGLAGGEWDRVEELIQGQLLARGVSVTVYDLARSDAVDTCDSEPSPGLGMIFTFLGTAAARPSLRRNVSGLGVQLGQSKRWMLFDCGEGTQHQLLRCPLAATQLDHVFITHLHGDHCFGLPGLLSARGLVGVVRPLQIFGPAGLQDFLLSALNVTDTPLPYPIEISEIGDSGGSILDTPYLKVEAVPLKHGVTSFEYVLKEGDRPGAFNVAKARSAGIPEGPFFGQLKAGRSISLADGRSFDGKDFATDRVQGRKVVIAGDNASPDLLLPHLSGTDLLIHESTYTEAFAAGKVLLWGHSTAASVARVAARAGVPSLILTHVSQRYVSEPGRNGDALTDLEQEAQAHYASNFWIADDFDTFQLRNDGTVVNLPHEGRKREAHDGG
ncbi:MAG: ribonuclease Z [Lentisphaeria bacterium]|nr:ribonuclease Z [Lentisphaeria bacterium]